MTALVVLNSLCPGMVGNHSCGADLAQLVINACRGEAKAFVTVKCHICRNTIGVNLEWRLTPVVDAPPAVAIGGK